MIVGLTAYANQGHIARAALEATTWQSREVVDAANEVADVPFTELRVDGGMMANEPLMQSQADVLGVPVVRPKVTESTALGAAYAAGLAVDFWSDQDELRERWAEDKRWEPDMDDDERDKGYAKWKKAVERALDWEDYGLSASRRWCRGRGRGRRRPSRRSRPGCGGRGAGWRARGRRGRARSARSTAVRHGR